MLDFPSAQIISSRMVRNTSEMSKRDVVTSVRPLSGNLADVIVTFPYSNISIAFSKHTLAIRVGKVNKR